MSPPLPVVRFKPGDTLDWPGHVDLDGVTDFTGYQVLAAVRLGGSTGAPTGPVLGTLTGTWTDAGAGDFRLQAAAAATAGWPFGRLVMDVKFVSPGGVVATTESFGFDSVPRVTP